MAFPPRAPMLTAAQIQRFRSDGFLCLQRLIDPAVALRVRERYPSLFAGKFETAFAVLCALHHPLTHYAVIQRKLGAALEGFPDHFHFVDGFAAVGSGSAEDTPIATLWDSIQKYLAVRPGPGLIIVDDLTTLGCLAPRGAVLRFAWALVTVARLHGYTVLLLAANDVPEEEHLVAQLRHLAAVHCDVTALASGYSRDVSGLFTVTVRDEATLRRTTRELQYKALDNTVRVVPRGSVGK